MGSAADHLHEVITGDGTVNDKLHAFFASLPHLELGYAEIGSTFQKPTGGAGAEDITGLVTATIPLQTRPFYLHFWCNFVLTDTANTNMSVLITNSANTQLAVTSAIITTGSAPGSLDHIEVWARIPAGQAADSYKCRINTSTAGARPSIFASATAKAFLRAIAA